MSRDRQGIGGHTLHRGDPGLSTADVMQRVGVTFRQITTWARAGWIPGQPVHVGEGSRRSWTESDLYRVRMLAAAARLKALTIPELAEVLAESGPEIRGGLSQVTRRLHAGPSTYPPQGYREPGRRSPRAGNPPGQAGRGHAVYVIDDDGLRPVGGEVR